MQRWGSEQEPGDSVLLRTGALMSLASLGTAGLVVCGALAVGGPSGGTFPGAFSTGTPSVTDDPAERPTGLAAPAARGTSEQPEASTPVRPAARRDGSRSSVDRTVGGAALSGATSSAARAPSDLDSVVHPARRQLVVAPSVGPPPSAAPVAAGTAQRPMSALRIKPVPPPPAVTVPSPSPVAASTATPTARRSVDARPARPEAAEPAQIVAEAPRATTPPQVAKAPKGPEAVERVRPAAAQPAAPSSRTAPQPEPEADDQAADPRRDDVHVDHPKGGPAGQGKADRSER